MDTRLAADAVTVKTISHSLDGNVAPGRLVDFGPRSFEPSLGRFARVTCHGDGTQTLAAQHIVGDFDGDGVDDLGTAAAISEDGHVLVTNNQLIPAVQQFRDDAIAAIGTDVNVLAFSDLALATQSSAAAQVTIDLSAARFQDEIVINEIMYFVDDHVAGSDLGLLAMSLIVRGDEADNTLVSLSGTTNDVAAQLRGRVVPIPLCSELPDACKTPSPGGPVSIPNPNLLLTYELTSLDGSKVVFVNNSGLVARLPEPATISLLVCAGATFMARRRR
ncbi:MAG: PEP-CTERM sorting domain-containing protein [Phycisphaeraceae bacterium]|jgi:hypothetical protein|nr:PEP-CTERM sorting domain-containing protein [Phycisphaeraceae bacterium]